MRRITKPAMGALGTGLLLGVVVAFGPTAAAHGALERQSTDATRAEARQKDTQNRSIPIRPAEAVHGKALDSRALAELDVAWEQQINGYYCGPAATRMALKANHDGPPNQQELAGMLGTDEAGTDHIGLVTDVMNNVLDTNEYASTMLDYSPTPTQKEQFGKDVKAAVDKGYAVVANIWVVDGGPRPEGYPAGDVFHYVTVIGYSDDGTQVLVSDPTAGRGSFENVPEKYWIDSDLQATLIGGKGYAA